MQVTNVTDVWPGGISAGLSLDCSCCGMNPKFDYTVSDDFWAEVVPAEIRRNVVCLPCLDEMASERGLDVSTHLERVQFTGNKKTIMLKPTGVYYF